MMVHTTMIYRAEVCISSPSIPVAEENKWIKGLLRADDYRCSLPAWQRKGFEKSRAVEPKGCGHWWVECNFDGIAACAGFQTEKNYF